MTAVVTSLKMIPTREIKPYFRNPRENDKTVEKLIEIIPKVGFNVPLVIDHDNIIVKGHSRWRAAIRLGLAELPCVVTEADAEAIRLDRIADNRVHELSGWDEELLKSELAAIDSRFAVDLQSLGMTIEEEINDTIKNLGQNANPSGQDQIGGPGDGASGQNGGAHPFISQKDIDGTHPNAGQFSDYIEVTCSACGNNMFIRKSDI